MIRSVLARCSFALLGGLALFLADYPVSQPWLVLLAFAPLLWVVLAARARREAVAYGILWGLGRTVPLACMLGSFGLPVPARFAVEAYVLGLDAAFALIAFELRALRAWPVLVAINFAVIEYADSRLPMWGTSRSVARLLSPYPHASGLVHLGGTATFAAAAVLVQALFVLGVQRRQSKSVLAGAVVLAVAAVLSVAPAPVTTRALRVAAVGRGLDGIADRAEAFVAEAAKRRAKIIVFPEVAFRMARGARSEFERHWSAIASQNAIFVVVPYVDEALSESNRLMVFDSAGQKRGEYTKRHLVPRAERSPPGEGPLLVFDVSGVRVGALICQDDNFSDLTRAYVALGAQLLVVPTFEGPAEVAPYHLRNSALRAIEQPIALVRSAAQGESAAIAPGGKIIDSFEPDPHGAGVMVTDVPVVDTTR
jgi:apolipoprotein N-acyltransferase